MLNIIADTIPCFGHSKIERRHNYNTIVALELIDWFFFDWMSRQNVPHIKRKFLTSRLEACEVNMEALSHI